MRRVFVYLAVMMIIILTACENKTHGTAVESSVQIVPSTSESVSFDDVEEQASIESVEIYDNWARIVGGKVYIDYKRSRREYEGSNSLVFCADNTNMTAITYNTRDPFNGSEKDAFDLLNNGQLFVDLSPHTFGEANFFGDESVYSKFTILVEESETVEVNGISTYHFTGNVTDADGRVCYVYGYSFVLDNTPCMLAGTILTVDKEQELIDAIKEEVDTMILTVRTEL